MGNMKILNTNTATYTIELHEAKVVPFKKLEQAWTRTNGDKAKQAKLIKKHDLKTLISTVRPGSIKLGVMNKLNHVNGNATAAGLDLDGELIFITNNPVKIIYPKKSSRRPEGEEIEEADDAAIVEEKKSLSTLRLEKVASLAIKEDDQGLIEAFVKTETFSIDSTPSKIKEAYKIFEASAKWIIYDKKTGKQLSPSKSWVKWQGAKMAAAKIGGNAEPADAAWYHDNKAKLLGEATDLEEAIKVKTHRGMYSIKKGEESLKSWVEKIVIMSDAVKQKQRKTITQNIVKAIESGKIKNADLTQGLTALIGIDAPADMEAPDRVVKSELKKLKLLESLEEAIVYRDIRHAIELLRTTPGATKFRDSLMKKDQDAKISSSDLKKAKEIFANMSTIDSANVEKKRKDRYFPRFGVKALEESTDLEEAKRMKYDKVIKKLKDGEWDTSMDVKQRMHLTYTDNNTGRKKVVFVEANDLEEAATWKSEGHYTADGKEWTGDQHEVDGQVMTGKVHTDDSVNLYHFKELSPEVRKQVAASFE